MPVAKTKIAVSAGHIRPLLESEGGGVMTQTGDYDGTTLTLITFLSDF